MAKIWRQTTPRKIAIQTAEMAAFLMLKIIKKEVIRLPKIDVYEKYKYLIGTKINKWTILDIKNNRTHPDAICRCDCGTEKPVNIRNLIHNCSKDCGCGRKQMLRDKETKNLVGKKFGKLSVIELLPDSNKFKRRQYKCKCDCGNEIIVPSSSLTTNHTLSCGCLNSYYNIYIDEFLNNKNIRHKREYTIHIDDKYYRFDFYLPDYNLFIEYDGQQHYEVPRYYGDNIGKNKELLQKIQTNDKIKNQYCIDNNINLLRIPYFMSKDIEDIISNYLQRLNEKGIA